MSTQKLTNTSLYDYLGRAAGPALGKAVATAAKNLKERTTIREVDTPNYKGPIMEYRKEFLDTYFSMPENQTVISKDKRDHEKKKQLKLPF